MIPVVVSRVNASLNREFLMRLPMRQNEISQRIGQMNTTTLAEPTILPPTFFGEIDEVANPVHTQGGQQSMGYALFDMILPTKIGDVMRDARLMVAHGKLAVFVDCEDDGAPQISVHGGRYNWVTLAQLNESAWGGLIDTNTMKILDYVDNYWDRRVPRMDHGQLLIERKRPDMGARAVLDVAAL